MAGIQQLLMTAGHFTVSVSDIEETGGGNQASATFGTDGTLTISDGNTPAATSWGTPTLAGIGSSYWVKVVNGAGSTNDWGLTAGTWYQLSSARSFTSPVAEGQTNSGTIYLSATGADSGIVESCAITLISP